MENEVYEEFCQRYVDKFGSEHCKEMLIAECGKFIAHAAMCDRRDMTSGEFMERLAGLQNAIDIVMTALPVGSSRQQEEIIQNVLRERMHIITVRNSDETKKIGEFEDVFSTRIIIALSKAHIYTFEQLCRLTQDEVRKIRNIGDGAMEEICQEVKKRGLSFCEIK